MFTKVVIGLLMVTFIFGCDNVQQANVKVVKVAEEEKKTEEKKENFKSPEYIASTERWLEAINRSYKYITKSCWDAQSETWLVHFAGAPVPKDEEDDSNGWFVVTKMQFKEMGNGTIMLTNPRSSTFDYAVPDVSGLICKDVK